MKILQSTYIKKCKQKLLKKQVVEKSSINILLCISWSALKKSLPELSDLIYYFVLIWQTNSKTNVYILNIHPQMLIKKTQPAVNCDEKCVTVIAPYPKIHNTQVTLY